jgi:hypothetical protein
VIRRSIAAAAAAAVLLAAAPATPRLDPVPAGPQTALVRRYVDALAAKRYAAAYALLDAPARAYFRNARNYASAFTADGFALDSYTLLGARGNAAFRLYFAREAIHVYDPVHDVPSSASVTVAYGVIGTGSRARIKDLGRPWRAVATSVSSESGGLRVSVKKVSFYAHAIACVVTFTNLGNGFLTLLPYGRSVLRDAGGRIYRPIVNTKSWADTDRELFLGVRLASGAEFTGVLSFAAPRLPDGALHFTLTVGPNLRDGAALPFALDVANIAAPA